MDDIIDFIKHIELPIYSKVKGINTLRVFGSFYEQPL